MDPTLNERLHHTLSPDILGPDPQIKALLLVDQDVIDVITFSGAVDSATRQGTPEDLWILSGNSVEVRNVENCKVMLENRRVGVKDAKFQNAIGMYTAQTVLYGVLNERLKKYPDDPFPAKLLPFARLLYHALRLLSPVKPGIRLYRGLNKRFLNDAGQEPQEGEIFQFRSFTSFSRHAHVAEQFAARGRAGNEVIASLSVETCSETSGVEIAAFSESKDEEEVLFPAGTFWKVKKLLPVVETATVQYEIEQVPFPTPPLDEVVPPIIPHLLRSFACLFSVPLPFPELIRYPKPPPPLPLQPQVVQSPEWKNYRELVKLWRHFKRKCRKISRKNWTILESHNRNSEAINIILNGCIFGAVEGLVRSRHENSVLYRFQDRLFRFKNALSGFVTGAFQGIAGNYLSHYLRDSLLEPLVWPGVRLIFDYLVRNRKPTLEFLVGFLGGISGSAFAKKLLAMIENWLGLPLSSFIKVSVLFASGIAGDYWSVWLLRRIRPKKVDQY